MATSGTTTRQNEGNGGNGRHNNGKRQHDDMRHDNGDRRKHGDGKGQQGDRWYNDGDGQHGKVARQRRCTANYYD